MKVGIAGIGVIAKDYIARICEGSVPDMEIMALSSRNRAHIEAVQSQYPALEKVQVFCSYEEMLASGSVEAVLICTPHAQHPDMALAALKAGLSVLVEKPVGIDRTKLRAVEEALAARPELTCGVLYVRRMSQAYRKVKELVCDGAIGKLVRATWLITNLYRTNAYYASGSWRGTWQSEGGGLLMTQASHQLDLLQWICGMPESVTAHCSTVGRKLEVENDAELLLRFPGGAHGQFIASAHETPGTNRLELCGTCGRIVVENDSDIALTRLGQDEPTFAASSRSPFAQPAAQTETLHFNDADNCVQQAAMLEDFAQATLAHRAPACPFTEGLHSLDIIRAAYLSTWMGVEVPIPAQETLFETYYQQIIAKKEEKKS